MNLFIIPGFMADKTLWQNMDSLLSPLGNIIYGDLSKGASLQEIALNNIAISPERFVLVGFSLGGYVARWMAHLVPERLEALVLIATSNMADNDQQKAIKNRTAETVKKDFFGGLSTATIQISLHKNNKNNKQLIEHIRVMSLRLGPEVLIRQLKLQRENPEYLSTAEHFPVLVIASSDDELRTLAEAQALQQQFPESTLHIIEGAGHMLPLEQPEALVKTICSWLEDNAVINRSQG